MAETSSDNGMGGDSVNVLLVDVDSKIPNFALMKIAAYHRGIGDNVGFNVGDPGKVYASVVFRKNRHKVDGLRFLYPDADIDIGDGKVRVEIGLTLREFLDVCGIKIPKGRKKA